MIWGEILGCLSPYPDNSGEQVKEDKMDNQDKEVKGTDIVTIMCMVVFSVCLGILLLNLPFGTVS